MSVPKYGGCLNFKAEFRADEGGDLNDGAGRIIRRIELGKDLVGFAHVSNIGEVLGEVEDMVEGGSGGLEGALQIAKGLADYRQGRFASAAKSMQKSIADPFYGQGHSRYLQSYMVLAMSHYRMNEYDEAREAFAKGIEIGETKLPKLDSDYLGPDWYWRDLVIAHALKNEARALLEGLARGGSR